MVQTLKSKVLDFRTYWKIPMPGRYMPFKEIIAYAVGGMGAYLIITMASILIVSTNNMVVSAAVGVSPTHMYILYIISIHPNLLVFVFLFSIWSIMMSISYTLEKYVYFAIVG